MTGFDLLSLNPTHFEMVINKLHDKSYFRLQQTSKLVNETIHNSKNICVHLPDSYAFDDLYFQNGKKKKYSDDRDVECFYGTRFAQMFPNDHFLDNDPEIFGKNCDDLKKQRITCDVLDLGWNCTPPEYMQTVIEIVNPRAASVVDHLMLRDPYDDAQRCEALLQAKATRLEEVRVCLDLENTVRYAPRLFSKFSSVRIQSDIDSTESEDDGSVDQFVLLHIILKFLRSQPYPNLRNFSLWAYPHIEFSSDDIDFEMIKREFDDLNWTLEGYDDDESDLDIDDEEDSDEEEEEKDEKEDKREGDRDDEKDEEDEEDEEDEDDSEDDSDYEDDDESQTYSIKLTTTLDLPAGQSCKIFWEKSSDFPDTHLCIKMGEPSSF